MKRRISRVLFILCAALLVLPLGSCSWRSSVRPSVLVIMVEHLGFGSFSCGEDGGAQVSGLQTFCEESVRFTHAFTPSVMSSAAAISVLTGKYPFEHGVRHNGPQALAAKETTVAEWALNSGFRTSFFSGGPPIWRRSGLNQGFEVFDDNISPHVSRYYRPAQEVVQEFLDWQENEASRGKFLSVLFLADLQFIDAVTLNELGEERERSYASQIDAIDEALGRLVKEMKSRKIWNNTDIILVGLDGYAAGARSGELPSANLFSEATRTTLMIKPRRRMQDGSFNWKIDSNVSLIDVGRTLFDLIGAKPEQISASPLSVSLKSTFISPEADWSSDRKIISESAWSAWRGISGIRAAVRQGPFLLMYDESMQLFDTLTDNMEISPLPLMDTRTSKLRYELADFLQERGYSPWIPVEREVVEKAALGRELWRNQPNNSETLQRLKEMAKKYPDDAELRAWRATWALRINDWNELKSAALTSKDSKNGKKSKKPVKPLNEVWHFIAMINLGESTTLPSSEPCLSFYGKKSKDRKVSKDCRVESVQHLLDWSDETLDEAQRTRAMEAFIRTYSELQQLRRASELSVVMGSIWDTPSVAQGPSIPDLILAMPEMRKYRLMVRARIAIDRK